MALYRLFTAVVLAVALLACTPADDHDTAGDMAFINAKAYTLDDAAPWAEAVVLRGDTIVYVGDGAGAQPFIGPATRTLDLEGKLLLPGFIDAHMHPLSGGAYAQALSLETAGTVAGWVEDIAAYAAANPDDAVLFGYGFLATTFGPQGPTRQMIDAIVPDRPVLIMDEGFHGAWANTAALEALNITQDTPDPEPGYSYYKRDANGDATGYLLEKTAAMAMDALDVISEDTIVEGTALVLQMMNGYGVTAAFDAGALGDPGSIRTVLERLVGAGKLSVRLVGSYRPQVQADYLEAAAQADAWRRDLSGATFRYDTLKIPLDGTVEGRTAAMFEDYQGEPGNSGATAFTEEQVIYMVSDAAERGIDVHVHALGERAVHESLNAIEVARKEHPDSATRYTLCHVQVITDQDLPRFAELGVMAQSTPLWASYDTYGKQFVSEDQFRRFWRYRGLEETGARLTFGSDFPASGAGTDGLSPLLQIEIGHTRQNPGEPEAPVQPPASERLGVAALVRGFTIDAAYQLHMEDQIGSIEVGKKADLVVLDRDIFTIDPYTIHETRVLLTLLGGQVVYEADAD